MVRDPADMGGRARVEGQVNTAVHFSSQSVEWATPDALFDELNAEFGFTLDACGTRGNAKTLLYFDEDTDALSQEWTGTVWCNPPYGRGIGAWVQKARMTAIRGSVVVMLLPARTDTKWFHDTVLQDVFAEPKRTPVEIRFIRGRLKFSGAKYNAPFPSMVVIFKS